MANDEKKYAYSDKPLGQRLLFFFAGFFDFLIGFALYYLFKDDKSKEWQVEFIQRGAVFGLCFTIIGAICGFISGFLTALLH